jgi:hypothetical protein
MLSLRAIEMMASPRSNNSKCGELIETKILDLIKGFRTAFLELAT